MLHDTCKLKHVYSLVTAIESNYGLSRNRASFILVLALDLFQFSRHLDEQDCSPTHRATHLTEGAGIGVSWSIALQIKGQGLISPEI